MERFNRAPLIAHFAMSGIKTTLPTRTLPPPVILSGAGSFAKRMNSRSRRTPYLIIVCFHSRRVRHLSRLSKGGIHPRRVSYCLPAVDTPGL